MIQQVEITLRPHVRGFHLVTEEIVRQLPPLPQTGLLNLFIQHTSAALSINENCDPDVRDDMPAHAKSTMIGVSLSVPVTRGQLNLGTWQGIYLCEFRNHGGPRRIVATIIGE